MEYSQVSMEPSWHMDRQEQVKIERLVYSDPEVTREQCNVPALLCILLSVQEPIAQFLRQTSAAHQFGG